MEFYTGIDRNRDDALEILHKDITDTCRVVIERLNIPNTINPYKYAVWRPTIEHIQRVQQEIGENVLASGLPVEIKDHYSDTTYNQIRPFNQTISIHNFFEEYQLHSFLIGFIKDFDEGLAEVERLLPYLNSWALTDSMRVKAFDRDPQRLLPYIGNWLDSDHPYTVRYGILCLMNYFLDDRFQPEYLEKVSAVRSEEYYVNMMIAWYYATALAKQYEATVPYIEEKRLSTWVHNKTIQKAIESYRITDEQKAYLRTLKIK